MILIIEKSSKLYFRSCRCSTKSVAPRGLDYQQSYNCPDAGREGGGLEGEGGLFPPSGQSLDGLDMLSWVLLGSCATLSAFLAATTVYYRRKASKIVYEEKGQVSCHLHLIFIFPSISPSC